MVKNINDQFKLVGCSDIKLANKIGDNVTLWTVTRGNRKAIIETEKHDKAVILIVSVNNEVYELERLARA